MSFTGKLAKFRSEWKSVAGFDFKSSRTQLTGRLKLLLPDVSHPVLLTLNVFTGLKFHGKLAPNGSLVPLWSMKPQQGSQM